MAAVQPFSVHFSTPRNCASVLPGKGCRYRVKTGPDPCFVLKRTPAGSWRRGMAMGTARVTSWSRSGKTR